MSNILNELSYEERKQVGNRIRGARIMTGLNQEEFSKKFSISLSTLKNFEIARVIPRPSTVSSIINAINSEGVSIDNNWIIYGTADKNNIDNTPSVIKEDKNLLEEINVLKNYFINMGRHPVTLAIKSNNLSHMYHAGDILFGVIVEKNKLSKLIHKQFLVEVNNEYSLCSIIQKGSSYYAVNNLQNILFKLGNEKIAEVVWHRYCR